MFHKYSERIHFPIITNPEVEFMGKWFLENQAYSFKMYPGKIYRYNNRCMHTVKNPHNHFRCHVMIDFIHGRVLRNMVERGVIQNLKNTVTVTPADEIYYYVNTRPTGASPVALTDTDIEQLKSLKNYNSGAGNNQSKEKVSEISTAAPPNEQKKEIQRSLQDTLAQDLETSPDSYDISQKLPDLINTQIYRLATNGVYKQEANEIAKTCIANNLAKIVDFGCWAGLLASEVFDTGIQLKNYHLIDAIPMYIGMAKTVLDDRPVSFQEALLVPESFKGSAPRSILIHPYDTLNSTSIYSDKFLSEKIKSIGVTVPTAKSTLVDDFVINNPGLFDSDSYVKIDIDGVDLALVTSILKHGHMPGAIQLEVWNTFKSGYAKIANHLAELGYMCPTINLNVHQNFSVGVSKTRWWAVGYDPDKEFKVNMTYYSSDDK
jgi:hypothetical protein